MAENMGIKPELFELIEESVNQAPYYRLLGIQLEQLGNGWAVLGVTPQPQHTNPIGMVHGGLIMSLGDAAMANAVRSLGLKGVTTSMNVDFMRPAKMDSNVTARGEVLKAGSNLVFARAVIENGNKVIAATSGTFYVTGTY